MFVRKERRKVMNALSCGYGEDVAKASSGDVESELEHSAVAMVVVEH